MQGKDQNINPISYYIHINNIKKKVVGLLEDTKFNKDFILQNHTVFINYLFDQLVKPDLIK